MNLNEEMTFITAINLLCRECHENARAKGFWPPEGRNKGEMMMLEVSEIAERLEAVRHGNPPSEHCPELTGEEEECADLLIRLADYCQGHNVRLGLAVLVKMSFNSGRPHKHGKEF